MNLEVDLRKFTENNREKVANFGHFCIKTRIFTI